MAFLGFRAFRVFRVFRGFQGVFRFRFCRGFSVF